MIVGGPGSGKTTLARQLGDSLRLPLHELDEIAFFDFRTTLGLLRRRPHVQRRAAAAAIARQPAWICEGMPAGWMEALLAAADLVIWLDLPWHLALRRVLRRFLRAVRFDPLPPEQRRWQVRPFVRGLLVTVAPIAGGAALRLPCVRRGLRRFGWWYLYLRNTGWAPLEALDEDRIWSHGASEAYLQPHSAKLLRLRRPSPADEILARWWRRFGDRSAGGDSAHGPAG